MEGYYVLARKEGSEEPWKFVRPSSVKSFAMSQMKNPYVINSENEVALYVSELQEMRYETIVTSINSDDEGICLEKLLQNDKMDGYTADCFPPRP